MWDQFNGRAREKGKGGWRDIHSRIIRSSIRRPKAYRRRLARLPSRLRLPPLAPESTKHQPKHPPVLRARLLVQAAQREDHEAEEGAHPLVKAYGVHGPDVRPPQRRGDALRRRPVCMHGGPSGVEYQRGARARVVGDDLEDAEGEREDAIDRAQGEDPEVVPFALHGGFAVQERVDLPPVVVVDVDDLG